MAGRKLRLWLVAVAGLAAVACGTAAVATPTGANAQEEARIEALERRVERLEAQAGMGLPPNLMGRIGIDRTWIPAAVDARSVIAVVERIAPDLGFREPHISRTGDEETVSIGGIEYRRSVWFVSDMTGPCNLLQRFLTLLESQPVWPTLVVDSVNPGGSYGPDGRAVGLTISFHITTRTSDEPPESSEEYDRLIADRGAAAAFSCEPIPTLAPTPTPPPTATPTP